MTSGRIGQLYVIDARRMALDRARDVLAHQVNVVHVELEEEIVGPDAADDVDRLLGAGQKEAGHVVGVNGSMCSLMPAVSSLAAAYRRFLIIV